MDEGVTIGLAPDKVVLPVLHVAVPPVAQPVWLNVNEFMVPAAVVFFVAFAVTLQIGNTFMVTELLQVAVTPA